MSAFDISEPSGKLTPSLLQQQAASDDGLLDRHSSRSPTIDLETTTPTTVGEHTHVGSNSSATQSAPRRARGRKRKDDDPETDSASGTN
ncbi:hypothetical protein I316_06576 [Kwoniella heveanensis BCC8398]|uniref:Uncharacterized protein n=1 Tax=Kwoniella heveanensis BCC8398 TaxID=1296120 RepID=A0A1B9GL21_9TREE|nr:hypothetical protein I316_06576 [Kwoniella heveanensis BCC8398]